MSVLTTPRTETAPIERSEPLWGLMAEFETPGEILEAARKTRDAGYKWFDCHSPFPVHGIDQAMGIKPTILPILAFFGGLTGCIAGFVLQWFTNASGFDFWALVPVRGYEYLISGKPMLSGPAWIPVMFELTILLAALGTVGWMLLLNGLPQHYHPTLKSERFARVTNDRFFLVIEARDPKFTPKQAQSFMESLDPVAIERLSP